MKSLNEPRKWDSELKTRITFIDEAGVLGSVYYPDIYSVQRAKQMLNERGIKNVKTEAKIGNKIFQIKEPKGNQDSSEVYTLF